MKEYKVYLNDLDYITLTDANNKLKDKGIIKSNIIFYNTIKHEDLYKIRSEISWYLVNQKCLDKINNLQSKIDKANEILDKYAKTNVEDYKKIIKFYKELKNVLKEDK